MLSLLLGFAHIQAEIIPDGIMPKDKRQVVGTGVTSSDTPSTSDAPDTSDVVTSDTPDTTTVVDPTTDDTPTTADPGTSDAPTSDPATTDAEPTTAQPTSDAEPTSGASDASPGQSSPTADESTVVPTSIAVTTTNEDGSTVTSQIATSTLAPVSRTRNNDDSANSVASTDSNIVRVGSSTIDRETLSRKTVITSALLAKSTSRSIYTSYWTSDGQVYSSIVTEDRVYSSTTGFATATIKPSLANGGGDGSNLSDNAKRVIGGVVGGIGGAILIGGLAFVAWRLWGKKKAAKEEGDEVWGGSRPDSIETAKRSSGIGAYNDTYSNPGGRINTSSNF